MKIWILRILIVILMIACCFVIFGAGEINQRQKDEAILKKYIGYNSFEELNKAWDECLNKTSVRGKCFGLYMIQGIEPSGAENYNGTPKPRSLRKAI